MHTATLPKSRPAFFSSSAAEAEHLLADKKITVAIVGFGYIGSCIGAVLADRGFRTIGIDTSEALVAEVNKGLISLAEPGLSSLVKRAVRKGMLAATGDIRAIADADIVLITVGTPLAENGTPDLSHIRAACRSVSSCLRKGQLVILKSTIPPGTTEGIVRTTLETSGLRAGRDFGLAFSPERLAEGRAISELLSIPIVVGGLDEKSAALASRFWEAALGVKTMTVSSPKTAELVKLADNLWIDLNIALGNELALLSEKLGIDALEVIAAANTLPKGNRHVNILMPSMGVGGYCLTKDPWFVRSIGASFGLALKTPVVSRTVNDAMPAYTFRRIEQTLHALGKELKTSKVAVLGLSFKSDTGDCRFTPTAPVIRLLEKSGCALALFDPLVSGKDARLVSRIPMVDSLEAAVSKADCIALFTGHEQFRKFPLARLRKLAAKKCALIDGRNIYSKGEVAEIQRLGFMYRGIGRA